MRGAGLFIFLLFYLAIIVVVCAGYWKVYTKAGEAGWKSIIPIWNLIVLVRIVGRSGWWVVLLLIPLVNIVTSAIVSQDAAKSYGRGVGFGVGLWLLAPIFYPILGFGSSTYVGPAAGGR
jgi:Family of unknown function (DUF5684)